MKSVNSVEELLHEMVRAASFPQHISVNLVVWTVLLLCCRRWAVAISVSFVLLPCLCGCTVS